MSPLFITVTDRMFFPGTIAAINSLLYYHPGAEVAAVSSGLFNQALTEPQIKLLRAGGIAVYEHRHFDRPGRVLGAWQLKTYAVVDLSQGRDIVVLFDSDMFFCSNVQDIIDECLADGKMRGGQDGGGVHYDIRYSPYKFPVPADNPIYMSTSCCFIPLTATNRAIVERWEACTNKATYGPQADKVFEGHGDQGVLNAVIYESTRGSNVKLLPNRLWSQHWHFDSDVIVIEDGRLVNRSQNGERQRAIHCGGSDKFWTKRHAERRRNSGQSQRWAYAAFLGHLFLGEISRWDADPLQVIPLECEHLLPDFVFYFQLIKNLFSDFERRWRDIGFHWINRCVETARVRRAMTLCGSGSMGKYIELARSLPLKSMIVEIGSFVGGSIITLGIALLDRGSVLYSVDSFTGNEDNTVDGGRLPPLDEYIANTKTSFPFLNINTIQLPSDLASKEFDDGSLDMVFVDGNHSTARVMEDINTWLPKLRSGGIMAGDDVSRPTVRDAVEKAFAEYEHGNGIWWTRIMGQTTDGERGSAKKRDALMLLQSI